MDKSFKYKGFFCEIKQITKGWSCAVYKGDNSNGEYVIAVKGPMNSSERAIQYAKNYIDKLNNKLEQKEQTINYISPNDETNYYNKLMGINIHEEKMKQKETKEQTTASSSGSYSGALSGSPIKRKITTINNSKPQQDIDEVTDASSSGAYTVPAFGKTSKGGRKDPLAIDGVKSIGNSRAVKDKNFPKFGGPGGVFVKVKDKCKKFPYCNQGDINAIEPLREAILETSKSLGIPTSEVEKIVLNEIKRIFI